MALLENPFFTFAFVRSKLTNNKPTAVNAVSCNRRGLRENGRRENKI